MLDKEDLRQLLEDKLEDYLFVIASNREPYSHKYGPEGKIKCIQPPSGMATALESLLQASNGTWVAHGSGDADKVVVDRKNRIKVPLQDPAYTLRRLWMNKREEEGYYYGFANEALWPLCHIVYIKPTFRESDWNNYKLINERFAKTILDEVGDKKAFVFLQDYHLTLVPKLLREANPNIKTALFWHIPWPNPEVFRICPWRKEILEGLLGADLLGFHIHHHVDNFLNTVNQGLEARVDNVGMRVVYQGRETLVRPYPISIDYAKISKEAKTKEVTETMKQLKKEFDLDYEFIGVGVDRIDYTKGLPERLRSIDYFLEKHPEYHGRFVFLQAGALSRIHLEKYKALNDEINSLVEKINWKYSSDHWVPIVFCRRNFRSKELYALYRMSHVCIVSSLHDGMNLVAKEYVSACDVKKGSLVLSRFTGAAYEMKDAVLMNPYDIKNAGEAVAKALKMPAERREKRMRRMKNLVKEDNIYLWASRIIKALLRLA